MAFMVNKAFTTVLPAGDAEAAPRPRVGFGVFVMRRFGLVGFGALALLSLSAPAKAEVVVSISKLQQRLAVVVDGTETYRWPVSTGRRGFETPAGTFHPIRLERHWYSRQYENSPMPWAMFFYRGYAMHGTVEVYNLGNAASHGCVRLRPDNAQTLYSLVRQRGFNNIKIVVMNGPLPALPGATPTADNDTPPAQTAAHESFAKAFNDEADRKRRSSTSRPDDEKRDVKSYETSRLDRDDGFVSRGSEAEVLRGREAWLRSLDRKYGIPR